MSYTLSDTIHVDEIYAFTTFFSFLKTLEILLRQQSTIINLVGYIGEFEIVDDHRSGKIVVQLIGRINKTGVISPRFNVKQKDIETWINNLLPSRQFGYIVLTTSLGIMDHEEARRKKTGGKILGFFY
jgi:ribosomal protein S8